MIPPSRVTIRETGGHDIAGHRRPATREVMRIDTLEWWWSLVPGHRGTPGSGPVESRFR